MGKASSFKIVRTTGRYFFGRGGYENLQKTDFFRKTLAPEKFIIGNFFQHRTIWKLTSGRFRKCISYEAYGDFYASYHRSKSTHGWKSESVPIIMRCQKKKTRPQFWKLRLEIESVSKQPCWSHADSISEPKSQNCGRVFFFGHQFFNFHPTLTANNYGLKLSKLKNYNIFGIARTLAFSWYHPI